MKGKYLIYCGVMILSTAIGGQIAYIAGFDQGADTTLCVMRYYEVGEIALNYDESCKAANKGVDSIYAKGLRLYRKMTNEEVPVKEAPSTNKAVNNV